MRFLRYPGGKFRLLTFLSQYLPQNEEIRGKYIEPFVGGGSIFFTPMLVFSPTSNMLLITKPTTGLSK